MADLVAGDVTYTAIKLRKVNSRNHNLFKLAFGDGVDTVPANGIPLDIGKMGCPNVVESLKVVDQGTSGYTFQYDQSAVKLVVMQNASHTHALHLNNADVTDGTTTTVNAGANLLGCNTGADLAVAGVADTTGVGGIVNNTALASGEASAVAIAAQTIEVEVIGW